MLKYLTLILAILLFNCTSSQSTKDVNIIKFENIGISDKPMYNVIFYGSEDSVKKEEKMFEKGFFLTEEKISSLYSFVLSEPLKDELLIKENQFGVFKIIVKTKMKIFIFYTNNNLESKLFFSHLETFLRNNEFDIKIINFINKRISARLD